MAIQLAKELTSLTVIATASRPESKEWAKKLGADQVVDHSADLPAQIREVAPGGVNYVLSPHSQGMAETFAEVTAPFGHIAGIDGPDDVRRQPAQGEEHRLALGADVHPVRLPDPRHGRAAQAPEQRGRPDREREDRDHADRDAYTDQRRER